MLGEALLGRNYNAQVQGGHLSRAISGKGGWKDMYLKLKKIRTEAMSTSRPAATATGIADSSTIAKQPVSFEMYKTVILKAIGE